MPITVEIPPPLREQAGGLINVPVAGATVGEALADLVRQYPALEPKLYDKGQIRPYINVFVNGEDYRYLDEMETAVKDGEAVALIPAVAGG